MIGSANTLVVLSVISLTLAGEKASTPKHYYAHDAVEDEYGVIAPWYQGLHGQCDLRVRIAAETLKRYPWTDSSKAVAALPEYIFSGRWGIASDGTITIPAISDWANGDLGQRAAYILSGMVDYYRYSGDPAAIAIMTMQADALLDYCLTPDDHPWPRFPISVPVKGKPYGQCDPHGFIQLDIVAEIGIGMVRAAQLAGNDRWLEAARHWGDLLAEHCDHTPGMPPWPRYANPEDARWEDRMTGGVAFILEFFDELIGAGYTGRDDAIIQARQAGVRYLRDVLLPNWTGGDTWGRNYWDWPCPVQVENVTEFVARYLMAHPDEFPNWRNDVRNILTLFLNRTGVSPKSDGDTFSGAWAYPESSGCCGRSLWYGPMELAFVYLMYGELADSEWGREVGRRMILLATYDVHETGVVEDNIDGGAIVAGNWFKIAHPMALKHSLEAMAWRPDVLGPARENHIMRSSSVVKNVMHAKVGIVYETADAPANTIDVLRLYGRPGHVEADDTTLPEQAVCGGNGYEVRNLPCGDCIVTIRHDGKRRIVIYLASPLQETRHDAVVNEDFSFEGNRICVVGIAEPKGGLADVYLDGVKQRVGIDCWNPTKQRYWQNLFEKNGLSDGKHTLKIVPTHSKNPLSQGTRVQITALFTSSAKGHNGFGEGGGPTKTQRMIFGYTGREDVVDSQGHSWRPGTEFVVRAGHMVDSVVSSWWTKRRQYDIAGTDDDELYRYGVHAKEFWVNVTVGPGTYYVRLKFAETRRTKPEERAVSIWINDQPIVADMDIAATAAEYAKAHPQPQDQHPYAVMTGLGRAVDLVFNDIEPEHGIIRIRLKGRNGHEAIIQAIEVGQGRGGEGATPVTLPAATQPAEQ